MMFEKLLAISIVVLCALCYSTHCLSMEDKVSRLSRDVYAKGVVRLSTSKFRTFIESPRNYSFIVLLNALSPKYECGICRVVDEEFKVAALSWKNFDSYSKEYFFGILDVDDGREIFNELNLDFVPLVKFYPANRKSTQSDVMNIQLAGFEAESILKFVANHCMDIKHIPLYRAIDWKFVSTCLVAAISMIAVLSLLHVKFGILFNRNLWGVICLIYTFWMLSGYMWTVIRSPPNYGRAKDGSYNYFTGDRGSQFVYESYAIATIYGMMTLSFLVMVESISKKDKRVLRSVSAVFALLVYAIVFSLFLSICKMKSGFYPFTFFFN